MKSFVLYLAFEFIPLTIAAVIVAITLYGYMVGRTVDDLIHTCHC